MLGEGGFHEYWENIGTLCVGDVLFVYVFVIKIFLI